MPDPLSHETPAPPAPSSPKPRDLTEQHYKPARRDFDADIERQLEEALAGMDDKSLYGEPERQRRGPAESGGRPKQGRVLSVHGDDVFIDVGGRSQGLLSASHFPEGPPQVGQQVEVNIEGYDNANGLLLLSRKGSAVEAHWESVAEGMIVEARVTAVNKGGLEVDVNGIRGFMPISHIELFRVEDAAGYVNQRLRCAVSEVNPEERNLVVSRRALLEQEREEAREKLWLELAEGQVRTGTVRSVKEFGAFLDLGGVDGLLHVSEMSWSRVEDATKVVQPGHALKVVVLKIDRDKRKVSLGLKQLLPSPWDNVLDKYPVNELVTGKVTRLMDFGAFVELEPGIEGLIHISELSPSRVQKVSQVVQPGQQVQVKVLKVDPTQRRISLSLKGAAPEPEAAPQPEEPETPAKPLPPRKTPLRGGMGG